MSNLQEPSDAHPREGISCEVAVLVPVYRNAGTLQELADRLAAALVPTGLTHRLLFVVDASPDDSWAIVERLASLDRRISGLLLAANQGQHRALLAGICAVRAKSIVVMDADLQDPPELVPQLIAASSASGLTAFARRKGMYQGLGRMITSRTFKTVLGWLIGMPPDVGTFLAMPSEVAQRIRTNPIENPQVVVMARAFSPGWCGVPYEREKRLVGTSAYSGPARIRAALRSLRCAWECRQAGTRGNPPAPLPAGIAARVNL